MNVLRIKRPTTPNQHIAHPAPHNPELKPNVVAGGKEAGSSGTLLLLRAAAAVMRPAALLYHPTFCS